MSIQANLSDIEDGKNTVTSRARWSSASTVQRERLKSFLLEDSYAFTHIICGHTDLVPELHMPLSYVVTGSVGKLAAVLSESGFDSYVTRKIRRELFNRGIEWWTAEGQRQLSALLDNVNIRWFRTAFKSSVSTHGGGLFIATVDPNETIKITCAADEKAWGFVEQIAQTVRSGVYQDFFADRVPDADNEVTMKHITLKGRTISHPQTTIQGFGYKTKDTGAHYSTFLFDDLVVGGPGGNATSAELPGIMAHLKSLTGFYMPTRRIRRIHVGTKWDEEDDDTFLTTGERAKVFLTVRVPIEEFPKGTDNILADGTPTVPQFASMERIRAIKAATVEEGNDSWEYRANYLLDISGNGMMNADLVNDPERAWVYVDHYDKDRRDMGRFLAARYKRDKQGEKIPLENWKGEPDDPKRFQKIVIDPWRDLDRVITLDSSWADGGDNWAVTCTGDDSEGVRLQMETQSDTNGLEGWLEALLDMVPFWKPRCIGIDATGAQDAATRRIIDTDSRFKSIRHLIVSVQHRNVAKKARIMNFVVEPLRQYRLLLTPHDLDDITRPEMLKYKGAKNGSDGILDSLAMAPVLHQKKTTDDTRKRRLERLRSRNNFMAAYSDPATGTIYAV